jgi:hypothetical protein
VLAAEKWLLNQQVRFSNFLLGFCAVWGGGVINPQKTRSACKNNCAKGYFGTTWGVLHRTSTKSYRRIEPSPSPMALWDLHFFGMKAHPVMPALKNIRALESSTCILHWTYWLGWACLTKKVQSP